jgi:hypothetical protein
MRLGKINFFYYLFACSCFLNSNFYSYIYIRVLVDESKQTRNGASKGDQLGSIDQ